MVKTEKSKLGIALTAMPKTTSESTQMQYTVDGCSVLLKFPAESDKALLNEIKRIMLSAAVKV